MILPRGTLEHMACIDEGPLSARNEHNSELNSDAAKRACLTYHACLLSRVRAWYLVNKPNSANEEKKRSLEVWFLTE